MNKLCMHVFRKKLFGRKACWTALQMLESMLLLIGVSAGAYDLSVFSKCYLIFIVIIFGCMIFV